MPLPTRMFKAKASPVRTPIARFTTVMFVTLGYSPQVFGQGPPSADPPIAAEPALETPREKAQRLLREGFAHLDEGESAAALGYFREAYGVFPRANLLLNIGSTLRQLGRNAESAAVYRSYLQDPDAAPARKEQVEHILREISLVIGKIRIDVGSSDAAVFVDGQPILGNTVRSVEVDVGPHTIIATVRGKPKAVERVQVAAGRETSLILHLEEEAPPKLVVVKERLPPMQVAGIVLGVVGVVNLGVSTVFGFAALKDTQDIQGYCSPNRTVCSLDAEKLVDSATFKARISTGALFVGGTTGLLGVVLLVVGRRPNEPTSLRPVAMVTPQNMHLGVMGTW